MAVDIAALTTELTTDPTGLGYSGEPVGDHAILNLARVGIQIGRGLIEAHEIINETVFAELEAVPAEKQRLYLALTGTGFVDVDNANVASAFAQIFGAATTTRVNLAALRTRDGSRAEDLFGESVPLYRVREALS